MSVIGYDGRIRPANRPTTASAPNELNPEMVKGLSEAQPKFVEGVVNLMNVSGKGAVAYGEALEKKRMRMEELDDKMYNVELQGQADKDLLNILNDDNLTPEQKKKKAEDYALSVEPTGNEERDKRREIYAAEQSRRVATGIYKDAMSMKKEQDASDFGAFLTVSEANLSNLIASKTPEILSDVKSIDELPEKLKEVLDPVFAKLESGAPITQQNKHLYERAKAQWTASVLSSLGAAYNKQNQEKIKDNHRLIISGGIEGAKNAEEAMVTAEAITGPSPLYTDAKRMEVVVGSGEAFSEKRVKTTVSRIQSTTAAAMVEAAKILQDEGDVKKYNKVVNDINKFTEETYSYLVSGLEDDRNAVINKISSNKNLTKEEREAYINLANSKYDKLVRDSKKTITGELEKGRVKAKQTKKKIGEAAFDALQKSARGQETEIPLSAVKAHVLLYNPAAFDEYKTKEDSSVKGTWAAFCKQAYPKLSEAQASRALVLDFKHRIARLDMNRKGLGNVFALETILETLGEAAGFDSDEYKEVQAFAVEGLTKEKNTYGEQTEVWVRDNICGGKTWSEWKKDATTEELYRALRFENILRETPEENWKSVSEDLAAQLAIDRSFDFVLRDADLRSMSASAKASAKALNEEPVGTFSETDSSPVNQTRTELSRGVSVALKEAELSALESGKDFSLYEARKIELDYWKDVAKKNNVILMGNERYDSGMAREAVISTLNRRKAEEEARERAAKREKELKAEMKRKGLPLDPDEYRSYFKIGGYSIDDDFDINLGPLVGQKTLHIEDMEEILRMVERYESQKSSKAKDVEAQRLERIRQLETEIKNLKQTKTNTSSTHERRDD